MSVNRVQNDVVLGQKTHVNTQDGVKSGKQKKNTPYNMPGNMPGAARWRPQTSKYYGRKICGSDTQIQIKKQNNTLPCLDLGLTTSGLWINFHQEKSSGFNSPALR